MLLPLLMARTDEATARHLRDTAMAFLPTLVARLRTLGATEIILFGSMVHGATTPESDLDLLVTGLDGEGITQARGRLSADAPVPVDIVASESAPSGLVLSARQFGVTLHAA